ncbi:hypothetical protein [Leptospira noguchii]|uniref:Flagellar motor switch protein FliG n=1 Tax=Leptospira noguchii serovar Autumnalis str. ZUN142 TaxID=1085540 RepID=M6UKT2_9LEPT|nr:hypothetical protein [Leptospira noguchii]EMO41679.1 hypothetical protein LEP1GSC186_2198 [Leptospira noguchii serovar Autumnalis str. ZUN142]UOG47311.1 hypothetical protein MAL00_09405 [Leptospira noguchii]
MSFEEGLNYFFIKADSDSVVRLKSTVNPFYDFKPTEIEELPFLFAFPALVPRFLYSLEWNRTSFSSKSVDFKAYLSFEDGKIFSKNERFPEKSFEISDNVQFPILQNPHLPVGSIPFQICRQESELTTIGVIKTGNFVLFRQRRNKLISTRYLSLKDIINPELSESEVEKKIESLYFNAKQKSYLFRLVKILFAGTPAEEQTIVSNLFSHEPEFAVFLRDQIFQIEILPLIHGPFLNRILTSMDERIIRFSYPKLSTPVKTMIEKNISKNKLKSILSSPIKKPEVGESLEEIVEKEIFKNFSRKIYYENGIFSTYQESIENSKTDPNQKMEVKFQSLLETSKFNFQIFGTRSIRIYSVTEKTILFQVLEWVEIVRMDTLISKRERNEQFFLKIPPGRILEILFFPEFRVLCGAGITSSKKTFEFCLLGFDY